MVFSCESSMSTCTWSGSTDLRVEDEDGAAEAGEQRAAEDADGDGLRRLCAEPDQRRPDLHTCCNAQRQSQTRAALSYLARTTMSRGRAREPKCTKGKG